MTVSLSFDGTNIRIVGSSGKKIEKWDSVSFDSKLLREGSITDTRGMAQVIKQALSERKLTTKNVRWALSSIGSSSQIITIPQAEKVKLETLVEREARKTLSVSPETSYLHWQLLPDTGSARKVYAVAIPREPVQLLIQACQLAGVTIESIDLKTLALGRAVNQKDAIIAHGEMNAVEMVIMLDSVPALTRGIWLREKDLDTGRVTALLLQQLASTIEYYNDMNRSATLSTDIPIYLTGETTLNPDLAERVRSLSGRPVGNLEPPLSYPEHFPTPLYMANLGLILKS
jgi:Tfp pilus assembly PilM family ATPase